MNPVLVNLCFFVAGMIFATVIIVTAISIHGSSEG